MENEEWKSQLYINNFSIGYFHGLPDRFITRLFPKSSLKLKQKPLFETLQLGENIEKTKLAQLVEVYSLNSKVYEIIDRIEIFGYTLERAKIEFDNSINFLIKQIEESWPSPNYVNPSYPDQEVFRTKNDAIKYFKTIKFTHFIESANEIIINRLRRITVNENGTNRSIIPRDLTNLLTRYIVCHGFGALMFKNKLFLLRSILESIQKNVEVSYEFESGGFEIDLEKVNKYYDKHYDPHESNAKYGLKTLILTEGKTDAYILEKALQKLYPHLSDIYHFFDFKLKEGSAKSLEQVVKSLAASSIPNNIIAFFDNDIEGNSTLKELVRKNTLPSNFKIFPLPDLEIADNYPVLGRNGEIYFQNVNGIGCAIEMFYGNDILIDNGFYLPLIPSENSQLKFSNRIKKILKKRMEQKLISGEGDWEPLKKVLTLIIKSNF